MDVYIIPTGTNCLSTHKQIRVSDILTYNITKLIIYINKQLYNKNICNATTTKNSLFKKKSLSYILTPIKMYITHYGQVSIHITIENSTYIAVKV